MYEQIEKPKKNKSSVVVDLITDRKDGGQKKLRMNGARTHCLVKDPELKHSNNRCTIVQRNIDMKDSGKARRTSGNIGVLNNEVTRMQDEYSSLRTIYNRCVNADGKKKKKVPRSKYDECLFLKDEVSADLGKINESINNRKSYPDGNDEPHRARVRAEEDIKERIEELLENLTALRQGMWNHGVTEPAPENEKTRKQVNCYTNPFSLLK